MSVNLFRPQSDLILSLVCTTKLEVMKCNKNMNSGYVSFRAYVGRFDKRLGAHKSDSS